ncbi:hypothetical protein [Nocardioides halotolerans]|uniref:hypothetical protein n=1 Tax=Nocardioides halotolerans TaxID=433660 RepID=UPI000405BC8A|nr:hypothetical protein [Nocardioides halotolerans]
METSWEFTYNDEPLYVYAYASGDPTRIGFRHDDDKDNKRTYLISRGIDDSEAKLLWSVPLDDHGGYTFERDDYDPSHHTRPSWAPDPRARVVLDHVNALTNEEILQIAQQLAAGEAEDAMEFCANRWAALERKERERDEAERRLRTAHLMVDALTQPDPFTRSTAAQLAPSFAGTIDEFRHIVAHLTGNDIPPAQQGEIGTAL